MITETRNFMHMSKTSVPSGCDSVKKKKKSAHKLMQQGMFYWCVISKKGYIVKASFL